MLPRGSYDGGSGTASPAVVVELVSAQLERIESVNPAVNAIVTLVPSRALEAAGRADAAVREARRLGPLHVLPIAHKDTPVTPSRTYTTRLSPETTDTSIFDDPHVASAESGRAFIEAMLDELARLVKEVQPS